MQDAHFIPYPVATKYLDSRDWCKSRKGQRLIVLEYSKYLAILGRDAILSVSRALGDKGETPKPGAETAGSASAAS